MKQNLHALRHVNAQKHVGVADDGRHEREEGGLGDGVVFEVALAERLHAEVPFDDELAVESAKDAEEDEEDDFEKVPVAVVADLEHD